MASNLERLRGGATVQVEPGVTATLDKEKKRLKLSSGEYFDVGEDPHYFPKNEQDITYSRKKEEMEKAANSPGGQFYHQLTSQGIPGGISDWKDYLTQSGDDYAASKRAQAEVSQGISKESPYISAGATVANLGADLALTRGLSAAQAAPLLSVGSAGSRVISEPENVLGEAVVSAGAGRVADIGANWLSNTAKRRGLNREIPRQQQATRESNLQGRAATEEVNQGLLERHAQEARFAENENSARLHQHNLEVTARKNAMMEAQTRSTTEKLARDTEVSRLENEAKLLKAQRSENAAQAEHDYKMAKDAAIRENKRLETEAKTAKEQYDQSLKDLPNLQKQAQTEYSENVVKSSKEMERLFPKDSRITTSDLGVKEFLDETIGKSGLAGSTESRQASRFLNSLFPEGEILSGRELSKRYKAIEDNIQRSTPEVQGILNDFKTHLSERLPSILDDSVAYSKIMPNLTKFIESDVKNIIKELKLGKDSDRVYNLAINNVKSSLREQVGSTGFIKKLQSGEFAQEIADNVLTVEDFLPNLDANSIKFLKKQGTLETIYNQANEQRNFFVNQIKENIQNKLSQYEIKAMQSAKEASTKLKKTLKSTLGLAEPIEPPRLPQSSEPIGIPSAPEPLPNIASPQLPPDIVPPQPLPEIAPPSLIGAPGKPNLQRFTPQAEPTLPPATNMAESAGDLLERPLLTGGRTLANNPFTKLAGLKYVLGKAALPAEAAYAGLKGLTSPTQAGEIARMTFRQGGIEAINSWAQKYPSYQNGVLQNPMDRRSLTKEIEDANDIPIEQKAILQSKVNRGKPLDQNL
jgi:hypothetical protein